MAEEIVDFTLNQWTVDSENHPQLEMPQHLTRPETRTAINPSHLGKIPSEKLASLPPELIGLYGEEAEEVLRIHQESIEKYIAKPLDDPEGFPFLEAQLRFSIRTQMVLHLEDFYLRRTALYASRKDHGLPWAERLSKVWAQEFGLNEADAQIEKSKLEVEVGHRSKWASRVSE
jgi:glycerol-3-phosphate dehydrogenase